MSSVGWDISPRQFLTQTRYTLCAHCTLTPLGTLPNLCIVSTVRSVNPPGTLPCWGIGRGKAPSFPRGKDAADPATSFAHLIVILQNKNNHAYFFFKKKSQSLTTTLWLTVLRNRNRTFCPSGIGTWTVIKWNHKRWDDKLLGNNAAASINIKEARSNFLENCFLWSRYGAGTETGTVTFKCPLASMIHAGVLTLETTGCTGTGICRISLGFYQSQIMDFRSILLLHLLHNKLNVSRFKCLLNQCCGAGSRSTVSQNYGT